MTMFDSLRASPEQARDLINERIEAVEAVEEAFGRLTEVFGIDARRGRKQARRRAPGARSAGGCSRRTRAAARSSDTADRHAGTRPTSGARSARRRPTASSRSRSGSGRCLRRWTAPGAIRPSTRPRSRCRRCRGNGRDGLIALLPGGVLLPMPKLKPGSRRRAYGATALPPSSNGAMLAVTVIGEAPQCAVEPSFLPRRS
jgi:hypothetical protein